MARQPKNNPTQSAKLTPFHDRIDDEMAISRFNWSCLSEPRETMLGNFAKKVRPPTGNLSDSPASAVHVLLPPDAPQDYFDPDFLIRHYETSLPKNETIAYVQITLRFRAARNLHGPFEVVREWVRAEFCADGLPAILVLHNPALVGSTNDGHVHVMVLPRAVSQLGWGRMVRDLANDAGRKAIWMSWNDYRQAIH